MAEITQKLVDGAGLQTAMGIMGNYSDNMDRGVVGGYNQSFPLTAATKGNIYYHKPINRYYLCVNNYSGSSLTNPNSNFKELSVHTNRQRFDNLAESFAHKYRAPYEPDLDFNEFVDFGVYRFLSHSLTAKNSPTTSQGCLVVYDAYYIYQIYYSRESVYNRFLDADKMIWSAWERVTMKSL